MGKNLNFDLSLSVLGVSRNLTKNSIFVSYWGTTESSLTACVSWYGRTCDHDVDAVCIFLRMVRCSDKKIKLQLDDLQR